MSLNVSEKKADGSVSFMGCAARMVTLPRTGVWHDGSCAIAVHSLLQHQAEMQKAGNALPLQPAYRQGMLDRIMHGLYYHLTWPAYLITRLRGSEP